MSRGIAARKPGEIFRSLKEDKEIVLQQILLFPEHEKISDSLKERYELIAVNQPISSSFKSAIVALFDNDKAYVKYVQNINNNGYGKWTSSDFKRETGYVRTSGASASENIPIKPVDLVGDETGRTIPEIDKLVLERAVGLLNDKRIDNQCYEHLSLLFDEDKRRKTPILRNGFENYGAYNKYLGEVLAPISVSSKWLLEGHEEIKEEHRNLFKSDDIKITYFQSMTNVLIDSLICYVDPKTNEKVSFGISSKIDKNGGAAASIASLMKIIKGMNEDEKNYLLKNYSVPFEILNVIHENNQIYGIIELAKMFKLISDEERLFIISLFTNNSVLETVEVFCSSQKFVSENLLKTFKLMGNVTPFDLLNKQDLNPTYRPAFHLLAGLAKRLVLYVNQNIDNLSDFIKAVLDHNVLYQVYSSLEVIENKHLRYKGFKLICPSSYNGNIRLESSKNYYMTGIKGKLCFKLK